MPFVTGQTIPGANIRILQGGLDVAFCQRMTISVQYPTVQARKMGSALAQEIVNVGQSVMLTVDRLEIAGDSPLAAGLVPRSTTTAILDFPELDFQVSDRAQTEVAWQVLRSKPTSMTITVGDGMLMADTLTFQAIAVSDNQTLAQDSD